MAGLKLLIPLLITTASAQPRATQQDDADLVQVALHKSPTEELVQELVHAAEDRISAGADLAHIAKEAAQAAADAVKELDAMDGKSADVTVDDEIATAKEVVARLMVDSSSLTLGKSSESSELETDEVNASEELPVMDDFASFHDDEELELSSTLYDDIFDSTVGRLLPDGIDKPHRVLARARERDLAREALTLVNYLPASCPADAKPRGVLFNHVSKLGGSGMRETLSKAASELNLPFHYAKSETWDAFAKSDKRAIVFQHDVQPISVSDEDRKHFFVVAPIRPPCEYLLSMWAYKSDIVRKYKQGVEQNVYEHRAGAAWENWYDTFGGVTPPYGGIDDLRRFSAALRNVTLGNLDTNFHRRYIGDSSVSFDRSAHCWVHTSRAAEDLAACLDQYAACGGERLNSSSREALVSSKHWSSNPSEHESCGSYYNQDDMDFVLASNPRASRLFGGLCCGA